MVRFNMGESSAKANWRRYGRKALAVYCIICAVIVTAVAPFLVWCAFRKPAVSSGDSEATFVAAHQLYVASEYPRRGSGFWTMVTALREYVAESPVAETNLFAYLGMPDWFYVTNVVSAGPGQVPHTNRMLYYAYLFDRPGKEGKWSAVMQVGDDGRVHDVAFPDAGRTKRLGFRAFPINSARDQQGGAKSSQPPGAEENGTPGEAHRAP